VIRGPFSQLAAGLPGAAAGGWRPSRRPGGGIWP